MESTTVFVTIFSVVVALSVTGCGNAAVIEHTFIVSQISVNHLCKDRMITVVNGQLPGPTIEVREGDDVAVHVINNSPYGITIHWHGVKQRLNCWNDGVGMVTQCPIQSRMNYTYRFNVAGQEGTLWWHAHVGCLRKTVHGALVIRPRSGPQHYPFPTPDKEIPIVIGEWWEIDHVQLEKDISTSTFLQYPSAATINGMLGDLYNCSGVTEDPYILNVESGKTYLLRMVNAALYNDFNFKIAGHKLMVVATDANYVKPYTTDVVTISPGQSVDVLVSADAPPTGRYYMAAKSFQPPPPDYQTMIHVTRGIVQYTNPSEGEAPSNTPPLEPEMPDQHDTTISFYFQGNLTSLTHPHIPPLPEHVDEHLYITLGVGSVCKGGRGQGWSSSVPPSSCNRNVSDELDVVGTMNNFSFILPPTSAAPLLEAHYNDQMSSVDMIHEFPDSPLRSFNFTDETMMPNGDREKCLWPTTKVTATRLFRYNTSVEVVFQGTAIMQGMANPMHLHGHDFFVLAQGYGNYDADRDSKTFNLVDPPLRNTVLVPRLGWTAVRFITDNPGVWYIHCHYEFHTLMGMAAAFVVANGPTLNNALPPPPPDFPRCDRNSLVAHE